MIRFLKPFLIFVVMYHIFVTVIGYGVLGGAYPQLPALGRDAIRLFFFTIIVLMNFKRIKEYLKVWKRPWITFIALIIFGTGISLVKEKGMYDIFVGIKYGLLYLFIFLSASFIGYLWNKKDSKNSPLIKGDTEVRGIGSKTRHFTNFLKYLLITTLIGGFLRQGLKFLWPDLFLHIGYGPLNDFKFGVKPPIYYLTGYKGTPRRQGIFSGPNNYGYFLIAFLPVVIVFFKQKFTDIKEFFTVNKKTILNTALILLRLLAIVLTLSRTAFIGGIVGLTLINMQRVKQHKKLSRGILLVFLAGIIGLSVLKRNSTLGHIQAKFGSIKYVVDQPSGYGLGTSGPAVNHNGTILPENYYLQLMLDIGTIGFIIRTLIILQITRLAQKIQKSFKTDDTKEKMIYLIWKGLNIGRVSLLIMGMFLHVFEDSMVNYLFFISRGILMGYLSTYINKK